MPELPEVETIKQDLIPILLNTKIINITKISGLKLREIIPEKIFSLKNKLVKDISRRSKFIILRLEGEINIIIHLGMTGKILVKDNNYLYQKHDHLALKLDNNMQLVYNDPRRFGLIQCLCNQELEFYFKDLGPEPFSERFSVDYIKKIFAKKKIEVKKLLMDNKFVVGVGNIYACESLFLSKIHPKKLVNQITDQEIQVLRNNILLVLSNAIASGGSSLKDYATISGEKGYFQNHFNVYSRENKECFVCNHLIVRIKQAGRSTFFCPVCQDLKERS